MEKQKAPISIRIFYWIMNFSMVMTLISFVIALVLNVLLYTDGFGNDAQLTVNLPVAVNVLEQGNLHLNGMDIEVELVKGLTQIHFIDTPKFISKQLGLAGLIMIVIGGILINIFRKFIKNVKEGEVFSVKNISLLKKLSYGLVGVWLLTTIYKWVFYYYIAAHVEFEGVEVTHDVDKDSGILLVALFIWVLAHIFITGLKLQEEKELTI